MIDAIRAGVGAIALVAIATGTLASMQTTPAKPVVFSHCAKPWRPELQHRLAAHEEPMELVLRVDALEREFAEMNRRLDEALRTLEVRHDVIRDPIRNGVRL